MSELQKEFEEKFDYKIGFAKDTWDPIKQVDIEGLWLWIEQKLKEAKIEENKLWVSKCKLNPLSSQEFLVAREAFEERIKKLSELKGEK